MMKRLLPVAAAVVIGLSPNFAAAAASKGGKATKSAQPSVTHVMHDSGASFVSGGHGFKWGGGRVLTGFDFAATYIQQDNNGAPLYLNLDTNTEAQNNSSSGHAFVAGMNIDNTFSVGKDADVRMTFTAGDTLRLSAFADTNINPNGGHAGEGQTNHGSISHRLENLYATYDLGSGLGFLFGRHTAGLTAWTDLTPQNVMPRFNDLLEYTTTEASLHYVMGGFNFGVGLMDPGYDDANDSNSRASKNANQAKTENYFASVGFEMDSGDMHFGLSGKYLRNEMDLTNFGLMNEGSMTSVAGEKPHAWAVSGCIDMGDYALKLYHVTLEKFSTATVGSGKSFRTNDAELSGGDFTYKMDDKNTFGVFYDDNANNTLAGLYGHQFGVSYDYAMSQHSHVKAGLMHYNVSPSTTNNMHHATVGAVSFVFTG